MFHRLECLFYLAAVVSSGFSLLVNITLSFYPKRWGKCCSILFDFTNLLITSDYCGCENLLIIVRLLPILLHWSLDHQVNRRIDILAPYSKFHQYFVSILFHSVVVRNKTTNFTMWFSFYFIFFVPNTIQLSHSHLSRSESFHKLKIILSFLSWFYIQCKTWSLIGIHFMLLQIMLLRYGYQLAWIHLYQQCMWPYIQHYRVQCKWMNRELRLLHHRYQYLLIHLLRPVRYHRWFRNYWSTDWLG